MKNTSVKTGVQLSSLLQGYLVSDKTYISDTTIFNLDTINTFPMTVPTIQLCNTLQICLVYMIEKQKKLHMAVLVTHTCKLKVGSQLSFQHLPKHYSLKN